MKTKKKYGQHFLINIGIREKVVQSIIDYVPMGSNVLEVGPGEGVITKYLVKLDYNFKVAEIDPDMVKIIQKEIPQLDLEQIHEGDVIKMHPDAFFGKEDFHLVGNFPYNVSSQLLFMMFDNKDQIHSMVGMFQKEVADRVVAKPDSKIYGILSVLLQAFYDCKRLFLVSPGSFNPPPKVDSAVIGLKRNDTKELPCDTKFFKQVVKLAFSQRRKMLRNTLKPLVTDPSLFDNPIFTKRPEHLSVEEFITLATLLEKNQKI